MLINGAGGGVGLFAVQLAKLRGRDRDRDGQRAQRGGGAAYGADEVIDYTTTALAARRDGRAVVNLAAISPESLR